MTCSPQLERRSRSVRSGPGAILLAGCVEGGSVVCPRPVCGAAMPSREREREFCLQLLAEL
jgi:hypothetical protein